MFQVKKPLSLKNLFIGFIFLTTFQTNVFAQKVPADTAEAITEGTSLVSDSINFYIREMENKIATNNYSTRDYFEQLPEFTQKLINSLQEYQSTVGNSNTGLLAGLATYMEQYNSIYLSKDISEEQKKIILKSRKDQITSWISSNSTLYHQALRTLFIKVIGDLPLAHPTFKDFNRGDSEIFDKMNCSYSALPYFLNKKKNNYIYKEQYISSISSANGKPKLTARSCLYSEGTDNFIYEKGKEHKREFVFKLRTDIANNSSYKTYLYDLTPKALSLGFIDITKVYYPTIKGSCRSEICLGLRVGDLITFIKFFQISLNKDMTFKLLDGSTFKLEAIMEVKNDNYFDYLIWQLSQTNYPEKLPFSEND